MAEDRLKSLGFMLVGDAVRAMFSPTPEALGRATAEAGVCKIRLKGLESMKE